MKQNLVMSLVKGKQCGCKYNQMRSAPANDLYKEMYLKNVKQRHHQKL